MNWRLPVPAIFSIRPSSRFGPAPFGRLRTRLLAIPPACACAAMLIAAASSTQVVTAQVITVDTGGGKGPVATPGQVDRQFSQITPTQVDLPKTELDPKSRILLERDMQSDQGFANRPFPRGHKGLTLQANGKLEPAGVSYLNMVVNEGLSAKPGTRVVVSNIKIDKSRIILDFDGGPDAKHRFLRHIQISAGGPMDDPDTDPTLIDQQGDPAGSRITLVFPNYVPDLTSAQVKALLAPLISFDVKSPIQAYTDTLPNALKDAILSHKVLVGMNTDMVMFAKGQPNSKSREMDGQMPFEEWIYGTAPDEVDFVRINGNRVIRVEIAKDGRPLQVFTTDVVSPMLMAAGTPELAETKTRTIKEGDVDVDPDKQEAPAPPSLRKPGETLPTDHSAGEMRPVQFPKPHSDNTPGADPDEQSSTPQPSASPAQPAPQNTQTQPATGAQAPPASTTPPASDKQQPPAGSNQLVSAGTAGTVTN
ncbi:MAG: hypothetical protein ABSE36_02405 [Terracidiphilus sp.]|jgi:hypothetical protein